MRTNPCFSPLAAGPATFLAHDDLMHVTPLYIKASALSQATAEANNLAAVATAKDTYNKKMEEVRI